MRIPNAVHVDDHELVGRHGLIDCRVQRERQDHRPFAAYDMIRIVRLTDPADSTPTGPAARPPFRSCIAPNSPPRYTAHDAGKRAGLPLRSEAPHAMLREPATEGHARRRN